MMKSEDLAYPYWYRKLGALPKALRLLYAALLPLYLGWLAFYALDFRFVASYILIIVEVLLSVAILFTMYVTAKMRVRKVSPPLPGKSVDVFVTTLNEDLEILDTTIRHCLRMKYPHVTWVLDDGNRPAVKELAEKLGARYIARSDRTHAKAGNLNHALSKTDGEFFAVFDADNIPHRDFLVRTLGYFEDPSVAAIQTNQMYCNLDGFNTSPRHLKSSLWNEQSIFFDAILPGRDARDAALWCGGGGLLRRSHVEKVGGIATESVTEDSLTTVRFFKEGLKVIYHPEILFFNLAPRNYQSFLIQRHRWQIGAFQILRREWRALLLSGRVTVPQRISLLAQIYYYFESVPRALALLLPLLLAFESDGSSIRSLMAVMVVLGAYLLRTVLYYYYSRGRGSEFAVGVFYFLKTLLYFRTIAMLPFSKRKQFTFRVTPKSPDQETKPSGSAVALVYAGLMLLVFAVVGVRLLQGELNAGLALAAVLAFHQFNISREALRTSVRPPYVRDRYCFFSSVPVSIAVKDERHKDVVKAGVTSLLSESEVWVAHAGGLPQCARNGELTLELGHKKLVVDVRIVQSAVSGVIRPYAFYQTILKMRPLSLEERRAIWDFQIEFGLERTLHDFSRSPHPPEWVAANESV